jgi:hypothetical protein
LNENPILLRYAFYSLNLRGVHKDIWRYIGEEKVEKLKKRILEEKEKMEDFKKVEEQNKKYSK